MTLTLERRDGAAGDRRTTAPAAAGSRHALGRLEALDRAGAAPHAGRAPSPPVPPWRRLLSAVLTVLIVAVTIYLWPARLGGSTRLVIVSGTSMEPVYDLGDVVIARDGSPPAVGDIVVFAVPDGEPAEGMLVIHRIIGVDDDGFFVTQGDNRDTPDHWQLTADDVVGEPLVRLPKAGLAIFFLRQWWVLVTILGLLVVFLLWPAATHHHGHHPDDHPDDHPDEDVGGHASGARWPAAGDEVAHLIEHLDDRPLDPEVVAEAEVWLDQQLGTYATGS